MEIGMKYIKTLGEMTRKDCLEAGGKVANLSEMSQTGLTVPAGFCVTGAALQWAYENGDLFILQSRKVTGLRG